MTWRIRRPRGFAGSFGVLLGLHLAAGALPLVMPYLGLGEGGVRDGGAFGLLMATIIGQWLVRSNVFAALGLLIAGLVMGVGVGGPG